MNGEDLATGLVIAALMVAIIRFDQHGDHRPLKQWSPVGSSAFATIVNPTSQGPLDVVARAPEVDNAERYLGSVAPRDTLYVKLPYVDARVLLRIGGSVETWLNVDRPLHARITLREKN